MWDPGGGRSRESMKNLLKNWPNPFYANVLPEWLPLAPTEALPQIQMAEQLKIVWGGGRSSAVLSGAFLRHDNARVIRVVGLTPMDMDWE